MKTSWLHVIHHNLFLADWLALRVFTASSLSTSSFIVVSFAFLIFVWSKLPCCCCQMTNDKSTGFSVCYFSVSLLSCCQSFIIVNFVKKGLKLIAPHLWINHNVFLNTVTPTVTTRRHCFEPHKSSDWWVLQRYTPSHFHIPKIFKPNHITITFTHTAASFPQHALCSITFSLLAHVFVVVAIGSRG